MSFSDTDQKPQHDFSDSLSFLPFSLKSMPSFLQLLADLRLLACLFSWTLSQRHALLSSSSPLPSTLKPLRWRVCPSSCFSFQVHYNGPWAALWACFKIILLVRPRMKKRPSVSLWQCPWELGCAHSHRGRPALRKPCVYSLALPKPSKTNKQTNR